MYETQFELAILMDELPDEYFEGGFEGSFQHSEGKIIELEHNIGKWMHENLKEFQDVEFNDEDGFHELVNCEPLGWYDYDIDMVKVSEAFPEVTFELTGFGEEYDDIWRCFYHNGKTHGGFVEFVFPSFNANLLE